MKRKMKGVLGIGIAFMLVASLMMFAIPISADPYEPLVPPNPNMWDGFTPTPGGPPLDLWFNDPDIGYVGPMAEAINGDLYAAVGMGSVATLTLGTWSDTEKVSGSTSALLDADTTSAHAYVDFTPPTGITTADLAAAPGDFGFYYYYTTGLAPHFELQFSDGAVSPLLVDITFMLQGEGVTGSWQEVVIGTTSIQQTSVYEWTGPNQDNFGFDTAAGLAFLAANFAAYELTNVRVELYPANTRTCYIDDVTIAGVTYDLEGENGSTDPGTALTSHLFLSTDGARTWSQSTYPAPCTQAGAGYYNGGPVVDMVCSDLYEDVIYVTDGNYVYKSVNGGITFSYVAAADLEGHLMGACKTTIVGVPITCIDVGYDGADKPVVFIGTRNAGHLFPTGHLYAANPIVGSVYWIADETFPASWTDLELMCYECCQTEWLASDDDTGCYDVYAVGAAPDFDISGKAYVVVTTDDDDCTGAAGDASTRVIYTMGTVCSWHFVAELFRDCNAANPFQIIHASRIVFPTYYGTEPTLFVGVATANGIGGDVYRVADTIPLSEALDLNVQGFMTGCLGLFTGTNICSLDIENDALIAGAWNSLVTQSPVRVYYSANGGWTWAPSVKDPTGADRCYVLFAGDSVLAATRGCDCAVSLSCGATIGTFFNQISLINMNICQVLDLSHAPGYLDGSSIMYVLTKEVEPCTECYFECEVGGQTYPCDSPYTCASDIHSLLRWDGTYWERVHSSRSFYATMSAVYLYSTPLYDWVECSPDFNETSCVYMANTDFYMARTLDAGCSWAPLTYPCLSRPTITAWIVIDLEMVLATGPETPATGNIYRTTNHGAQPWKTFAAFDSTGAAYSGEGVDFDLSPNIAADESILLGDDTGQVFLSADLGMTWVEIEGVLGVIGTIFLPATTNTYVVFDPGYGTADDPGENMIYAASGAVIGRCDLNSAALWVKQNWVRIDRGLLVSASGIDAAGDTALYVSDRGSAAGAATEPDIEGTIAVSYPCGESGYFCTCDLTLAATTVTTLDGTFELDEPVSIIEYNLYCVDGTSIAVSGDIVVYGLLSHAMGTAEITMVDVTTCANCNDAYSGVAVISSVLTVTTAGTGATGVVLSGVVRSLNPMAPMPPVSSIPWVAFERLVNAVAATNPGTLEHPVSAYSVYPDDLWLTAGSNMLWALEDIPADTPTDTIWMWDDVLATPVVAVAPAGGTLLALTNEVTLEWEALDLATLYDLWILEYCPECPTLTVMWDEAPLGITVNPVFNCVAGECCYTVTGLDPGTKYFWMVRVAAGEPFLSKWSDLLSFDTALSTIPVLCSPECGSDDIILTSNFSWDEVFGATSYELQIVAAGADGTADFTGATTLTSDVNALASIPGLEYSTPYYWRVRAIKDGVFSDWAVCIFTTMAEPEEPVDPIIPVVIPPAEEISPMWIYVIIGIGAALVIVVLVLIVKTRRVS